MPALYEHLGIRFYYPENWSLVDEELEAWPRSVTVQSEETSFFSLHVYPARQAMGEIIDTVIESIREVYPELEILEAKEKVGDVPAQGVDICFFFLDLLVEAKIDVDELLALIDGKHDGDIGFLFSGQINLDTLDGITRCRAFMAPRAAPNSARSIVQKWATGKQLPIADFDAFWELKHEVYNLFIGAPHGAALDAIAQVYMRSNLALFSPDDFLFTERSFRGRHRQLFAYLDQASRPKGILYDQPPRDWMSQEVRLKVRSFFICKDIAPLKSESINARYKQTKLYQTSTLGDLIGWAS